jgi:DNA-directed RNA polymerase specialized sigma24 family protein
MQSTITRRAALTAPTRRQLIAASLAAAGAAAVPAGAAAKQATRYDDLHTLDDLLDGLPDTVRIMVMLNHIKTFPIEDRRRLVAQFREGISDEAADRTAEYLGVPA